MIEQTCIHWSEIFNVCILISNIHDNSSLLNLNIRDFKKDCKGCANISECVWYMTKHNKNKEIHFRR